MDQELYDLVRLVHSVVAEDAEVTRTMKRAKYMRLAGCAVCGEKDIPLIGHQDVCSRTDWKGVDDKVADSAR